VVSKCLVNEAFFTSGSLAGTEEGRVEAAAVLRVEERGAMSILSILVRYRLGLNPIPYIRHITRTTHGPAIHPFQHGLRLTEGS
jgi:hypothetical protein